MLVSNFIPVEKYSSAAIYYIVVECMIVYDLKRFGCTFGFPVLFSRSSERSADGLHLRVKCRQAQP